MQELKWYSYYIYFHDWENQDEIIELIYFVMNELLDMYSIKKWFFIRYWEGGPHIRVRILSVELFDVDKIFKEVKNFIKENPSPHIFTKNEYYSSIKFDGNEFEIDELPWYKEGEIIESDYIPEVDRYGGVNLMDITESMFMESSILVSELSKRLKHRQFLFRLIYSQIIMQKVVTIINLYKSFGIEKQEFYKNCMTGWQDLYQISDMIYSNEINRILNHNKNAFDIIQKDIEATPIYMNTINKICNLFSNVQTCGKSQKEIRLILYSHLHMFNNRFGVTPEYECLLYLRLSVDQPV